MADLMTGPKLDPHVADVEAEPVVAPEPFNIAKLDTEQCIVFGFANVSIAKDGHGFYDLQKDFIPPTELEKAAYDHVLHFREADEMHEGAAVGRLVESMVFTPDKLEKFATGTDGKVNEEDLAVLKRLFPTRWWVGYKMERPAFDKVKSGLYKMFSIAGEADREES